MSGEIRRVLSAAEIEENSFRDRAVWRQSRAGIKGERERRRDGDTGVIRVYDPATNTFGSYNPDGST